MARKLDFVRDPITRLIVRTSLPMLLGTMVSMAVMVANVFFMGNVSAEAIYIRSLYTPLAFLTIAIAEGFAISSQVMIARFKGAQNDVAIRKCVTHFVTLVLVAMLILVITIYISAPLIANFFGLQADVKAMFMSFLRVMFLTNILVTFTVVLFAMLRGYGHVKQAVILSVGYALLNVSLVFLFSVYWHQALLSIVYANTISSLCAGVAAYFLLFKQKIVQLRFAHLREMKSTLAMVGRVGIPVSLSYLVLFISTFLFAKIVAPFGEAAVTGFKVAWNIQVFIIVPALAIGSAIGLIMNHNIGSGKPFLPRVFATFKTGVWLTCIFYLVFSIVMLFFNETLARWMLTEYAEAIPYAVDYLKIVAPTYMLMGAILMTTSVLEQINRGFMALWMNAAYFATIIVVSWVLTVQLGSLSYFYWTTSFANIAGVSGVIFVFVFLRRSYGKVTQVDQAV
ncbi:MATE family efflux transporter [Bacillus sp. FSL W7-1360]